MAAFFGVASSVNIIAWRDEECNPVRAPVARCNSYPELGCCQFPDLSIGRISSVSFSTFPLPGGVGSWHAPADDVPCGRVIDAGGDSEEICLSSTGSLPYRPSGGGAMWFRVPPVDSSKTRTGTSIPELLPPQGYANLRPKFAGSYRRRHLEPPSRRDLKQQEARNIGDAVSVEEWHVSICRHRYHFREFD